MEAVAHSPSFAKKAGVPQSVGKDFAAADKGRKFSKGGDMATKTNPGFMAMMAKKMATQEGSKADKAADKKQMMGMKKGGSASSRADGVAKKGMTKGKLLKKGGAC